MNILLFGAGGLLGRHLARDFYTHGHQVTALTHPQADITNTQCLDKLFAQRPWDAVINAAAICDFDRCEQNPEATSRVNLDAPLDLADRCNAHGARFVQYSSDYIFHGDAIRPYVEDARADPLSIYGKQKAALEHGISLRCPDSLVLRISWLYGSGGRTFMSLLPLLLAKEKSLRVAAGKTGRCIYAPDAASWTRHLVESPHKGIFNLVNDGDTSWEEFAHTSRDIMKAAGLPIRCHTITEVPYTELGPDWKKRPLHSSLDISRLSHILSPGPRHWREALTEYIQILFAAPDAT